MARTPAPVLCPVDGRAVAMSDVPDAVFAEEMVGPGIAVQPDEAAASLTALAPVAGVVTTVHPHAFVVEDDDGRSVLVHLGIDTVELRGEGFTVHVAAQQRVTAGERVITWSPAAVAAGGRATVCPVVALEADAGALADVPAPGTALTAGQPLLTWG
ncbi:PTS sugar transporter subunit IIA [Cellulomonas marina]|uniref:PTS system, N-acetylglucosamine-specific IIA component n=1 Tax=Cellulomonas marina TaxID=988821 RepID=A0A1I0VAY8_9CELL|nr:PTS glucose transporter subunit IIA [Cellulomonas marina]GIG29213.1 PTS glucose transporter subunit IIA [Cellulomonas marina]SFA72756.1 PTS system, N-acetylglucosamine-specific IIA component [Cellulomonas marina]